VSRSLVRERDESSTKPEVELGQRWRRRRYIVGEEVDAVQELLEDEVVSFIPTLQHKRDQILTNLRVVTWLVNRGFECQF
jgi:hypothetical protein